MVAYLRLLNELKRLAGLEWLTPAQREIFEAIRDAWRFPVKMVLVGPPGSGKTFLGWVIAKELGASHFPSSFALRKATPPVLTAVVDNLPSGEKALRSALGTAQLMGVKRLLLIGTDVAPLGLPQLTLPAPTPADLRWVVERLAPLGESLSPPEEGTFWTLFLNNAAKQG